MTQTSLSAFLKILPELSSRQSEVLGGFAQFDSANDKMVALALDLGINQVTPRRGELVEKGVLEWAGEYPCPYSRVKTTYWRVA